MVDEPASKSERNVTSSEPREKPPTELEAGWVPFALLGFVVALGISVGTLGLSRLPFLSAEVQQPVEFPHRIHVQDLDLECSTCHEFFATETYSGLPTAETCSFCHEEAQGNSPEEQRLVALLAEGEPLEWQPLFSQPAHVFYSHRRHVTVAGLECEACHGDFALAEAPPRRVEKLTMEDCIACHEREGAATDCTACHR